MHTPGGYITFNILVHCVSSTVGNSVAFLLSIIAFSFCFRTTSTSVLLCQADIISLRTVHLVVKDEPVTSDARLAILVARVDAQRNFSAYSNEGK